MTAVLLVLERTAALALAVVPLYVLVQLIRAGGAR